MLQGVLIFMFGMWLISEIVTGGIWKILGFLIIAGLFAGACFSILTSLIATAAALIAWNRPRLVLGQVITPEIARPFVERGLWAMAGASVVMAVVHFAVQRQSDGFLIFALLFSYSLPGTVQEFSEWFEEATRPPEPEPPEQREMIDITPRPAPPPFRFASWDDEEAER